MNSSDPNLAQRRQMVDTQIRARGVSDPHVLHVMETTPRERFMPPEQGANAFDDRALPIDCNQTISQPYVVASMTAALRLQPHHRVLEIGTGSGYQTAILAALAAEVWTIERIATLSNQAREVLASLGINNVGFRVGDGSLGWPERAPFDGIIVTAGAPGVPDALLDQLVERGRLVIPVGDEHEQRLIAVRREHGRTIREHHFPCRFVRLIGEQAWPK